MREREDHCQNQKYNALQNREREREREKEREGERKSKIMDYLAISISITANTSCIMAVILCAFVVWMRG